MRQIPILFGYSGIIAQLTIEDKIRSNGVKVRDKLVFFQQQIYSETVCIPAQSIELIGMASILTLRDALNAAYPKGENND